MLKTMQFEVAVIIALCIVFPNLLKVEELTQECLIGFSPFPTMVFYTTAPAFL